MDEIVQVNPRHDLVPVADWAAEPQTKREEHFFQSTTSFFQNYSNSQLNRAVAGLQFFNLLFPFLAKIGQKAISRRGFFGDGLLCIDRINTDGPGRNKDLEGAFQGADQVAGSGDAGSLQFLLLSGTPAFGG